MEDEIRRDEDIWRILVATDIHLGYLERDPIRGNDSFDAFDEVLTKADQEQADFVLLAGDLFHDNNPSRYTLHRAMEILREHCFGARPGGHAFQILSEQSAHFQQAAHANMSDENLRIRMPIFSIHGNHDDPGERGLAALDLLHISSMINYFGKTEMDPPITVPPLMLRKGESVLALYGLGNIRDERLRKMWNSNLVLFSPPDLTDYNAASNTRSTRQAESLTSQEHSITSVKEQDDSFPLNRSTPSNATFLRTVHTNKQPTYIKKPPSSTRPPGRSPSIIIEDEDDSQASQALKILVLHQNRVPHSNNFIPEERVADFDFVVWGHEHQSIVTHARRHDGEPYISQPGSTVATSLSEGEADQKHAILLQVHKQSYNATPLPLQTVRPFYIKDITLAALRIPQQHSEHAMMEEIARVLAAEVESILAEIAADTCTDGTNPGARWKNSKLPLVRLKVNYTGYPLINTKRFGQDFLNRVANPSDILLFRRSVAGTGSRPRNAASGSASTLVQAEEALEIAPQHAKIDEFLQEQLTTNLGERLGVFQSTELIRTLQDYAEKDGTSLAQMLEEQLQKVQLHVLSSTETATTNPDAFHRQSIAKQAEAYHKEQLAKEANAFRAPSAPAPSAVNPPGSTQTSSSQHTQSTSRATPLPVEEPRAKLEEDEIDDYHSFQSVDQFEAPNHDHHWTVERDSSEEDEPDSPGRGRKRAPSRKTPAPRRGDDDDDDDEAFETDEVDEEPPKKRASRRLPTEFPAASPKPTATPRTPKSTASALRSPGKRTSPPAKTPSPAQLRNSTTPKATAANSLAVPKPEPRTTPTSRLPQPAFSRSNGAIVIDLIDDDDDDDGDVKGNGNHNAMDMDTPLPGLSPQPLTPLSQLPSNTQLPSQQIDSTPPRKSRATSRIASQKTPVQAMVELEDDHDASPEADHPISSPPLNTSRWGRTTRRK